MSKTRVSLSVLPGNVLLSRDPDITQSDGGILYPDTAHKKAVFGIVHLHCPSGAWVGRSLTNRRVAFVKYGGRRFQFEGYTFELLSEDDILATVGEQRMTRDELIKEVGEYIRSQHPTDRELTNDEITDLDVNSVLEDLAEPDEEESDDTPDEAE
jgi:co-chaperonin GroES (HSP10)